ncbi:MAG: helix-turn-helix transcriptional regulator [Clostridia bacterium]|nr:helix-turn-helix transcriptional regulator [Clostridia bacterium]
MQKSPYSARIVLREQYMKGYRSSVFPHDALRLVYIVDTGKEGAFDWLINDTRHRIEAGMFVLFTPADLRMPLLRCRGRNVRLRVITFHLDPTRPDISLHDMYGAIARMPVLRGETAASLMPLFNRLCDELNAGDDLAGEAAEAALRLFLVDYLRLCAHETGMQTRTRPTSLAHAKLIEQILTYLRAHLSEKLSIGDVAAAFGISESSLSKMFRSMVGMSFPEFVRRLRVNRVIDIICDGDTGVLDAAMEAGFGSISGFYKSFAAITGTNPSDFIGIAKNAEK